MSTRPRDAEAIDAVAALAEPTRRALYDLVAGSGAPVGREEAAATLGISRDLAAFHLDRLVAARLLDTEYRRRSGRSGPGAGRPAKLYRRADRSIEVTLPARRYERAADVLATAIGQLPRRVGVATVTAIARDQGIRIGAGLRRGLGRRPARARSLDALVDTLTDEGYEPSIDVDGRLCLRNCPFDALVPEHRDVTCAMNLAWAEGVLDGLGERSLGAELDPQDGRCCVVIHGATGQHGASHGLSPRTTRTATD